MIEWMEIKNCVETVRQISKVGVAEKSNKANGTLA